MPVLPYLEHAPRLGAGVVLADDAYAVGELTIAGPARLEASAVARGDQASIAIGPRCYLGRQATVHVDVASPTRIGAEVWIGDGAVVHGCTLGSGVRVEERSRVLTGSTVGDGSIVARGSLVPEGATFPEHSYLEGTPARRLRDTTPEERAETVGRLDAALAP